MTDDILEVVWDMETQDPDDFLTLLFLLGHPRVKLKAVTITPGSTTQVGHVRRALSWFDLDIPVGAGRLDHPKDCVSRWHARAYGEVEPSTEAEPAAEVLRRACDENTTLITGAPLKNLGAAMEAGGFQVGRWVAQGGFAGEGVVPAERQLEKFRGLETCPTFNLNGDPKAALEALWYPGIGARRFVSKNVCHGVIYDEEFHAAVAPFKESSKALGLIWKGMESYLAKKRGQRINEAITEPVVTLIDADGGRRGRVARGEALAAAKAAGLDLVLVGADAAPPVCKLMKAGAERYGKKLHDPLAACCALDEAIGDWAEVTLYREKGRWGSRLSPGSGTRIITGYDAERFLRVFTEAE